ncbi:hypothetical protein [Glutamicibacter mishrai]|uniref:Uncharacterized protein n=2 Tax=Glutamicibacter mishrai TaxID=1775880 RepID=A0A6H0SL34_9MICC|nr:hypothetical protein D3791_14300 [Glutamicibacter mishrai]
MDLVIATHRGVDFRFEGLNLTTDFPYSRYVTGGSAGFEFHLRGIANDETRRLESKFYEALESWDASAQEHGAPPTDPAPQMPSNDFLAPIKANITDDAGTTYICIGGRTGGTGTEWDATWIYYPAPPSEAGTLTLEFTISGIPTAHSCVIEL